MTAYEEIIERFGDANGWNSLCDFDGNENDREPMTLEEYDIMCRKIGLYAEDEGLAEDYQVVLHSGTRLPAVAYKGCECVWLTPQQET